VIVSAWKNGTYGIRIGKKNVRKYFKRNWDQVEIKIDGIFHEFKLSSKFWTTCPEIRGKELRDWLRSQKSIPWFKGHPPRFELVPLSENMFRLTKIQMPDRRIPSEIRKEYVKYVNKGMKALFCIDYQNARINFSRLYDLIFETQKKVNHPIHKGLPLHNLGISLFYLEKTDEALYNILCAYIEDTLNYPYEKEDNADRDPAAHVLRDIFYFNLRILREIKNISAKIKEEGKWSKVIDPKVILEKASKNLKFDINKLSKNCERTPKKGKPLVGFPQPREKRVFIGTNYDKKPDAIYTIKQAVIDAGFIPISAFDYGINPDTTHDDCLVLLHTCKYAVFEITNPSGQLMELERTHDYRVKVLLARTAINPNNPPQVSLMVKSLGDEIIFWKDPLDLYNKTLSWLLSL